MTRTAGAPIGCQRPSRFWGLGCPKIYHEAEDTLVKSGKAVLKGDRKPYDELKTLLVHFDLGFEMMPGTAAKHLSPEMRTFQQEDPGASWD
ncbi:hypothetical protein [Thiolapillus sp.]|uniref:hypothetical protein n=1 Tax=Thiolapillus sp. TaxID=2017437 RepID=UPI003AF532C3